MRCPFSGESPLLEEMLDRSELAQTVIHHYAPDVPEGGAVDIHDPEVWAAGNPGLAVGIKQAEHLRTEAIRVTATPSDLASFLAFELNLPQTPGREMIFTPADLAGCEVEELPERSGQCYLGLDFGEATSATAAAAIWPETGRVDLWMAFGDVPDLVARGRRDGARYDLMEQLGELRTYEGPVTPVAAFMADIAADLEGVKVSAMAADGYKDKEVQWFLKKAGLHWPADFRRVGAGKDGGADVRALQRLVLERRLRLRHSLAMHTAVSSSSIRRDGNGNPGLDKATGRGRIDLLSCIGHRRWPGRNSFRPTGEAQSVSGDGLIWLGGIVGSTNAGGLPCAWWCSNAMAGSAASVESMDAWKLTTG